jgi:ribosomal protein S18 acetylase RimI-like enzyme
VLGAVRSRRDSWAVRRDLYAEWLADPDSFALLAEDAGRPVGYAVVYLRGSEETWQTGCIGVLETLAVLPEHRGRGIGSALVERVFSELRRLGAGHFEVGVIASNEAALRFYERLGLERILVTFIGALPPPAPLSGRNRSHGSRG